jgi:hypothetical protein
VRKIPPDLKLPLFSAAGEIDPADVPMYITKILLPELLDGASSNVSAVPLGTVYEPVGS